MNPSTPGAPGSVLLRAVSLKPDRVDHRFPFTVPVIRELPPLEFTRAVTFLAGENGSGKSTLLEGLACAIGLPTVGTVAAERDPTLDAARRLGNALAQSWERRSRRGFFLRAEDFFGFAKRMQQVAEDAQRDLESIDDAYVDRSPLARMLARGPHVRTIDELERDYGPGLDARSHGESFLTLFQARLVPGGLYLLDEPEAPLSPLRQLALLSLLKAGVAQGSQFIIATHSPILLAFPEATILSCDRIPIASMDYDDLDHVQLTRDFLAHPERFLRDL